MKVFGWILIGIGFLFLFYVSVLYIKEKTAIISPLPERGKTIILITPHLAN
ncbi:MAG: hypothetical protein ACMG6E_01155 [Candidatus Roizmanbacteria bacterium]